MEDTVKLASLIFSVSQSTCTGRPSTCHAVALNPYSGIINAFATHPRSVNPAHLISLKCSQTNLPLGVAEDDGLRDGQRIVEIAECVELPLFPLHGHKELLDPFQCQLITEGTRVRASNWER